MATSNSTKVGVTTAVSSTGSLTTGPTSTVTESRSFTVELMSRSEAAQRARDVAGAVYSHLQAVRSLGREQVTADEIAQALGLPQNVVLDAVARLGTKGVRVIG